ncbi:unnamed protein product [Peniophora sp. CBMAI 1063]|nr:unnamed protein product [Peniophora sp. CBMAI 1063]
MGDPQGQLVAPRLRIAICGGGISGLTLAVALSRVPDLDIQLYEASARFSEIGAGVMIWFRTWRVLELLGLAEGFAEVAHARPSSAPGVGFDFRRSDTQGQGEPFQLFKLPYGCIRFHRAHFLDVLIAALPPGIAHFHKRLQSFSSPSSFDVAPTQLTFTDGTTATCDVLVGCDGIKSVVRTGMLLETGLSQLDRPRWSGTVAYRALVPVEKLLDPRDGTMHPTVNTPMMYCGKSKHVVSYGISRGTVVNIVAMASQPSLEGTTYDGSWASECTREEFLRQFEGWEDEVGDLLQHVERPTKWALHELPLLPSYTHGHTVLVGDAAHAMLPHHGAGAGQAIEDAYIIYGIFASPSTTRATLRQALQAYDAVRRPRAEVVVRRSREAGRMYESDEGVYGEDYRKRGEAIAASWGWLWDGGPEEDLERALALSGSDVEAKSGEVNALICNMRRTQPKE